MSLDEHSPARQGGRAAFTINEFCESHRLSRASFYNLRKLGRGPSEMHLGSKILISVEAAAEWRRRMEEAAATAA